MWWNWLPWRYVVSRLARSRGFVDPVALLSRLHRFTQPSEVTEPIELLRAGLLFQARGLVNTRAIQHNLDWVWPMWIERQFDPRSESFVPRAFSITHVNLTHRNWTAVGRPDTGLFPIVDPCGLVTPRWDGWSLDTWVIPDRGPPLLPSRAAHARQRLVLEDGVAVETLVRGELGEIWSLVDVVAAPSGLACRIRLSGECREPAWLGVAVRPANPEGVSFVHDIARDPARAFLQINDCDRVQFDPPPDRVCMSVYRLGDVLQDLNARRETDAVSCDVGMATAAALFRMPARRSAGVLVQVPLGGRPAAGQHEPRPPPRARRAVAARTVPGGTPWRTALAGAALLELPDPRMVFLYSAAVRNLVLFCGPEAYPGPYTYRRFWFRDAAFMLHALLAVGLHRRVRGVLETYPARQDSSGYFRSQAGEWDSNGAALWILGRYQRLSGEPLPDELLEAVAAGAEWVRRKRLSDALPAPHAGLLPAGFSAEHLGPNDFYYWDDFWSAAGLRAAAGLARGAGRGGLAALWEREAAQLLSAVDRSLVRQGDRRALRGVPASPYRRMDAGAVGSLAAGYPLQLWEPRDPRLLDTAEFLLAHCLVGGGFFQDMIHSGINPYLTLHLAQVLLRAGDERHAELLHAVAEHASPTGQWPEAIHPRTGGGCMGDGQHLWAAAEWVLMIRSLFVREEGGRLVLGSGLLPEWLARPAPLCFGPTLTPYGPLSVFVEPAAGEIVVRWEAAWRTAAPPIQIVLRGCPEVSATGDCGLARVPVPAARAPAGGWTP